MKFKTLVPQAGRGRLRETRVWDAHSVPGAILSALGLAVSRRAPCPRRPPSDVGTDVPHSYSKTPRAVHNGGVASGQGGLSSRSDAPP